MPPAKLTKNHVYAVLLRGCIKQLRLPRLCTTRACRRHSRCLDATEYAPPCLPDLHPVDYDRVTLLLGQVVLIVDGKHPPHPSTDPDLHSLEEEAICVLFDCLDHLPGLAPQVLDWCERYSRPPAPPEDTGKLLAEMKRELARNKAIDEIRGI